eukprot:TRINITY_DN33714_c0_g1_i1.p1 TRINITY_DN33714_c0_g1~~TRINITY_DN33714_c0_g1_i1.p1  ORF type:complete len:163 (-),score=38.43 TRINITY_DN33714_c0_g1_i1:318-806(-)
MVFGRKAGKSGAGRGTPPKPPNVDQILQDLQVTDDKDPVYQLSRDLVGQLVPEDGTGDNIDDPNVFYRKITEYINTADNLDNLCTKISNGTEALAQSHQDLQTLGKEVQRKLEKIKRGKTGTRESPIGQELIEETKPVREPPKIQISNSKEEESENEEELLC